MKEYVLVSQGIEIYRTTDREQAENLMNAYNKSYYKYRKDCYDRGEKPVDNEIFMYEEET